MRNRFFVAALGIALATSSPTLAQQNYNLSLAGASPSGLWSSVGAGFSQTITAAYPGSVITYQTSSGGLVNAKSVAEGKVPMGLAADMELKAAVTGGGPFNGTAVKGLMQLVRVYDSSTRFQMFHTIINRDFADKHGIKTFDDIIKKKIPVRVAVNRPGNMDRDIGLDILEGVGLTPKLIKDNGGDLIGAATVEITNLVQDRRVDLYIAGFSFNHSSIRDMSNSVNLMLLPYPKAVAEKVAQKNGGELCDLKPGEYSWDPGGLTTVCVGAVIMVSDKMDEQTAYALTKGMIGKADVYRASHRAFANVTPERMAQGSAAPLHPGAAKAFKEAGLLK